MANLKPVIGWREWTSLPDLGINRIKVKVDSGAQTSALHATNIKWFKRSSKYYIRFRIYPIQKNNTEFVDVFSQVVDERWIKSSNGTKTLRPVIKTNLKIGDFTTEIELTLVNRDMMGFRMLLGRHAFRKLFLIDANRSFLLQKNKIPKKNKIQNQKKTKRS